MLAFLLCYVSFIHFGTSSSESSSSDSTDDIEDLFAGTYTATLGGFNVKISVCEENDKFYLASRRILGSIEIFNYINMVGRSTSISANAITFGDSFRFITDTLGTEKISLTLAFDSGAYTLNGNTLTKESDNAADCLAPDGTWYDIDVPFVAESTVNIGAICGVDTCFEVQRFDSATAVDGACWGYYDLDAGQFITGGNLAESVQIEWDGELSIVVGTDEEGIEGCENGTIFQIRTDEDEYLQSFGCRTTSLGGGIYTMSTECERICDEITDECLLYDGSSSAKQMAVNNIENNEQMNEKKNEKFVIDFSDAVIGKLWAFVIVYTVFISILCWCTMQKRKTTTKM